MNALVLLYLGSISFIWSLDTCLINLVILIQSKSNNINRSDSWLNLSIKWFLSQLFHF